MTSTAVPLCQPAAADQQPGLPERARPFAAHRAPPPPPPVLRAGLLSVCRRTFAAATSPPLAARRVPRALRLEARCSSVPTPWWLTSASVSAGSSATRYRPHAKLSHASGKHHRLLALCAEAPQRQELYNKQVSWHNTRQAMLDVTHSAAHRTAPCRPPSSVCVNTESLPVLWLSNPLIEQTPRSKPERRPALCKRPPCACTRLPLCGYKAIELCISLCNRARGTAQHAHEGLYPLSLHPKVATAAAHALSRGGTRSALAVHSPRGLARRKCVWDCVIRGGPSLHSPRTAWPAAPASACALPACIMALWCPHAAAACTHAWASPCALPRLGRGQCGAQVRAPQDPSRPVGTAGALRTLR